MPRSKSAKIARERGRANMDSCTATGYVLCLMVACLGYNSCAASVLFPAEFPLVKEKVAADVVIAPEDFPVVHLATNDLAADVEAITGLKPAVRFSPGARGGAAVLIGTIGHSSLIDGLIGSGKIEIRDVRGKWETFLLAPVKDPLPGVPSALVIVGSDRRGTAFGIYELSRLLGVSPWYWWADVAPARRPELLVSLAARTVGPPAVKYRGIFLNDEDWGLRPWARETYEPEAAALGPKTYARVFELLLRLKANTLWPAMHEGTRPFNAGRDLAELADRYGIVMGSSHAEPMLRNNVGEWSAPAGDYNYATNREGVRSYWAERLRTNGRFENIYTLGMRGVHDSPLQGAKTGSERANLLNEVIADQRTMLAQAGGSPLEQIPQIFCAYSELLEAYRSGLALPADVTVVWPDDNYGYVRSYARPEERDRPGGFGVYYHVSYLGRPLSYLWLNTTPLALMWEEMTKSFAHGADRLWMLNVGDLKPAEIGTEFFLELAWDPRRWGPDAQIAFLRQWAAREFGADHAENVARAMAEYYRLNFWRKPEHLQWWFNRQAPRRSPFVAEEIKKRLADFASLCDSIDRIAVGIAEDRRDAFAQLVGYPVHASALANVRYFATEAGDVARAREAADAIREHTRQYNEVISGGKWRGFMQPAPVVPRLQHMFIAPWTETPPFPVLTTEQREPARRAVLARLERNAGGIQVEGLGRSGRAVRLLPGATVECVADLPAPGEWTLQVRLLPTHPVRENALMFRVGLDGGPDAAVSLRANFNNAPWSHGVLENIRAAAATVSVAAGRHVVRLTGIDEGVVVDEIVFLPPGATNNFLGPVEPMELSALKK